MSITVKPEQRTHFDEYGYLVWPKLFTSAELDKLASIYQNLWLSKIQRREIMQDAEHPLESLFPRVGNYHHYHPAVLRFLLHNRIISILYGLLGEEPLAIQSVYYYKPPTSRGLYPHQDNNGIGAYPGTCIAAWISIDPSNVENGGLYVVAGSHKLELLETREDNSENTIYKQTVDIPSGYEILNLSTMPGDAVFFSGNLLHGSHKNLSAYSFRRAFVGHYVGISTEMITMYRNDLFNVKGEKTRRKYNIFHKTSNRSSPLI